MAAADIARVVVGILSDSMKYAGAEFVLSNTLKKKITFEEVTVPEFLKLLNLENDLAKKTHFEAIRVDQQEGLLAGTDSIGTETIGQPLMTLKEFILANKDALN